MEVFRWLGFGAAVVLALTSCTFAVRESNVVIPRAAPAVALTALKASLPAYSVVETLVPVKDGSNLYSVRFMRSDAVATVLYFGANGYTVSRFARQSVTAYGDTPVNVVLVDHRGYGASPGTPTIDGLLSDAIDVYDHVVAEPKFAGRPIIVHGHSLGSFLAGRVAERRQLDGLLLEATVTSTEDWTAHLRAQQALWKRILVRRVVPTGALAGRGNSTVVRSLDEPVLFVVGAEDSVTPPRFAQALFRDAPLPPGRKRLLIVPGKTHINATDSPEFKSAFSALVATARK